MDRINELLDELQAVVRAIAALPTEDEDRDILENIEDSLLDELEEHAECVGVEPHELLQRKEQ